MIVLWVGIAALAQLINAGIVLVDKYVLASAGQVGKPAVYAFYVSILSGVVVVPKQELEDAYASVKGELIHLLHVLKGRPENWSGYYPGRWKTIKDVINFWRPDTFYYNQSIDDMLPGIVDIISFPLSTFKKAINKSFVRKKNN